MNFRTLRLLLISSFLFLSIVPLIGIAYKMEKEGERVIRDKVTAHLSGLADKSASHIDTFLAERIFDLRMFSFIAFSPETAGKDVPFRIFRRMQNFSGVYLDFFFLSPRGESIIASRAYDSPIRAIITEHFDPRFMEGGDQVFFSEVFPYPSSGGIVPAVLAAVPLLDSSGSIQGSAVAAVDFRPIEDYLRKTRIDTTGEAYLVDSDGYFLTGTRLGARPIKNRMDWGNARGGPSKGFREYTDYRGQKVFRAQKKVELTPWIIIAEQDLSESLRQIRDLRSEVRILTAIIIVVLLVIAWTVTGRIVNFLEKSYRHEKELEFQTIHRSKLAAIGMLTSGLAHELNTPLASALLYTQMLKEDSPGGDDRITREHLAIVEGEIKQCSHIVRNLLDVAGISHGGELSCSVEEVLGKLLTITAARLKAMHVRVIRQIDPRLPPVKMGESVIQEVLMNLFANALDAMPTGGDLTIAVRHVPVLNKVIIEIADTGDGIPADDLGKVFEPFFTTKPKGEGTGLGLFMSYEIVKRHGGNMRVISTPATEREQGATMFTVELPVAGTAPVDPAVDSEV